MTTLRLGVHLDRPERLALIRPDGSPAASFGYDETKEEALEKLAKAGIEVEIDGAS